jgi:hypothetical protein
MTGFATVPSRFRAAVVSPGWIARLDRIERRALIAAPLLIERRGWIGHQGSIVHLVVIEHATSTARPA